MPEIAVFRIADGRIAEKRGILDRLAMFQQLGAQSADHFVEAAADGSRIASSSVSAGPVRGDRL